MAQQLGSQEYPTTESNIEVNPTGKYYALLIGNSNYVKWASLTSPTNDVREIGKILKKKYKFEKVITVINGTEKEIFKAFKKLSKIADRYRLCFNLLLWSRRY